MAVVSVEFQQGMKAELERLPTRPMSFSLEIFEGQTSIGQWIIRAERSKAVMWVTQRLVQFVVDLTEETLTEIAEEMIEFSGIDWLD